VQTYLKERIGKPELFTGRKKELAYFLDWIDRTKMEVSQSTAILSRRKTGKTALLERLYNLTFHKNDGVIPFYFEIREASRWIGDFARDFFLSFIYQYIAFKSRNLKYLQYPKDNYSTAAKAARKEKLNHLLIFIENASFSDKHGNTDILWDVARDAPRFVAECLDERIVQMIDEFQFINRFIFWDEGKTRRAEDLAASYLHTCEYKNAPMLVTGSWVGWLMDDLNRYLPGRFLKDPLQNLPEDESVEMIYKYSLIDKVPVSEETVWLIARLSEGNPFYISALFRSKCPGRDLTTKEGVRAIFEFETLNLDATVNAAWMEYLDSAFSRINDTHAKDMVLYLSKNRHRYVRRKELKQKLGLNIADTELEKKFRALYRADIIEEHYGRYRGVQDNIFDKVFRRTYSDDIDRFVTEDAPSEYKALFEKLQRKYDSLKGEYGRYKGAFAEFMLIHNLSFHAFGNNDLFRSMMRNLPDDFSFAEYARVWSYHSPPLYEPGFQVDVFAQADGEAYSLIGEVKHRKAKFSVKEAGEFMRKAESLMKLEKVGRVVLFVFSTGGFFKNTLEYLKKHGIARTSDTRWLEKG